MNNPMNAMLQFINSGGDPRKFVESNLKNNPQFNQAYQQIKGMMSNSNMSSKEFAMQYFQKMGVDPLFDGGFDQRNRRSFQEFGWYKLHTKQRLAEYPSPSNSDHKREWGKYHKQH